MSTAAERREITKSAQITTAARAIFLERGYAATSMDAVTAASGVSKQTLYRYFPSKARLFAHILDAEVDVFDAGILAPVPITSVEHLRAMLTALASTVIHRVMTPDNIGLVRLIVGEVYRVPELRSEMRDVLPRRLMTMVESLLAAASSAGIVSAPRPDLSARMLVGSLATFIVFDGVLVDGPPRPPDAETIGFIVDAFLGSVAVGTVHP